MNVQNTNTAAPHAGPVFQHLPCIPFAGSLTRAGYGRTQFMGRQYLAHRLAYAINEMQHPASLKGVVIRHRCDNPACINVDHLQPGTAADNMRDKVDRGRQLVGGQIPQSKLTAAQVTAIRAAYQPRSRDANQRALAAQYGVSQATISLAIAGINWKHIK